MSGWLWLSGGMSGLVWLLVPGAEVKPLAGGLLAGVSVLAGLAALQVPWARLPARDLYIGTGVALLVLTGVIWATGGVTSPARLYLFMTVAKAAYYFEPARARQVFAGCVLAHASPVLYDPRATEAQFVGELVVVAPVYLVVGAAMLAAKSQLVASHQEAHALSRRDPLTGIGNRRAFEERIEQAASAHERIGVVLFDLDDFKAANTAHGHPGGDLVLRAVADALASSVRQGDLVARVGGDEFGTVMADCSPEHIQPAAERALAAIADAGSRLPLPGVAVSATAGWAVAPAPTGPALRGLMSAADRALLRAKELGKGRALGHHELPIEQR
jgi:diguanylate cyclase (GGDEF)-like protein